MNGHVYIHRHKQTYPQMSEEHETNNNDKSLWYFYDKFCFYFRTML